jgi:peptidoglycan-associated lipoprotein
MQKSALRHIVLLLGLLEILVFANGCKHNPPPPPAAATPAPAPAQPTVTLSANPTSGMAGDVIRLTWSSTNATDLNIDPEVGKVAPEGSTPVQPSASTTYTITATGPGGSATASARVMITPAAAPTPSKAPVGLSELFEQNVRDAFYDFNKSDIRADAREALAKTAEFLRSYPEIRVTIEGHCDERGSTEYNLGLGERRAQAAKNYLISLGITASRMDTVSWGKERPFCTEHTEECWQQNRRAHFVMAH